MWLLLTFAALAPRGYIPLLCVLLFLVFAHLLVDALGIIPMSALTNVFQTLLPQLRLLWVSGLFFCDAVALAYANIKGLTMTLKTVHLAGMLQPCDDGSMRDVLNRIGFQPAGRRAVSTVASRMAACVQPAKRVAPTILPEGLGPVAHLAVALQTQHPF
jgi:hypothetical protein